MEHSLVLKNANDPLGVPEKKCLLEGVSGTNLPLYFIMQQFFMLHFKILISTCKILVSCKMQKGGTPEGGQWEHSRLIFYISPE